MKVVVLVLACATMGTVIVHQQKTINANEAKNALVRIKIKAAQNMLHEQMVETDKIIVHSYMYDLYDNAKAAEYMADIIQELSDTIDKKNECMESVLTNCLREIA